MQETANSVDEESTNFVDEETANRLMRKLRVRLMKEEVFNDGEHTILFIMNIQSLLDIDTSVIDAYASLLIYEEKFKMMNMKRHFFFTSMMVPGILEDKTKEIDKKIDAQYDKFHEMLSFQMQNDIERMQMEDVELIIKFGDSYEVPASAATTDTASDRSGKKKGKTVTVTTEDMQKRKNDVKARTTLLLSLLDENQLQFSKHKTAQELWAAILKTFGGNEATKKTKKNLLKQQYGNFKAEGLETLEQTFNRLQRNVSDLDTMGLDDLYNHLKVYESGVQKKSKPNSQNMAFISLAKHSRGNEEVNTASVSTASTNVPTASANYGDINQIDKDDMEEMDIKWNMALLSIRADRAPKSQERGRRDNYSQGSKVEEQAPKVLMVIDGVGWDWSYMANDEENHAMIANKETPTEFALMAKTNAESEVFDNSLCSKACKKNYDSLNSKIIDLTNKLFDAKNMIYHYKLGLAQVESRLVEHKDQEIKYCEKIRGLELKVEFKISSLECLTKDLELLKKEKDMSWTGLPEFKDDTMTDYSRPSPTIESTSDDAQNRNPSVTETKASPSTISPKSFIKFVKVNDSLTKGKTDKVETTKKSPVKYAEQYRKPTNKPNKKGEKGTSRSSNNTHKSFIPRPVVHRPPVRPMRTNMNVRSQYRAPWVPTVNRKFFIVRRKFPTANRKVPTGSTKFSTADMGKKENAVKASVCWIWKPRQNTANKGLNRNSVSVMFKKAVPRTTLMIKVIGTVAALGT
uniref:Uncharacterized protein n=1 Tax=Tanacetum cinerariifolium TaxID=118510 RepID=A0A6L2MFA2_TANCI|nr:hypothetical protein [Tanacetum cinerariifolium]